MAERSRRHRWVDGCFAVCSASVVLTVTTTVGCGGDPTPRPAAKPGEVATVVGGTKDESFIGMTATPDGTVLVGLVGEEDDIVRAFERSGRRRDVYREYSPQFNALAWDAPRRRLFGAQSSGGDGVWEVLGRTKVRPVVTDRDNQEALDNPGAITVDPDSGDLYIADSGQRRVLAVRKGGGQPSVLTALTDLRGPTGLAFDPASKVLFVADGGRVLRVGVDGTPPVVVAGTGEDGYGGDGGPATAARLGGRLGLAFDLTRRVLYIADTANHRVRCVNAAGVIRTVAGNGDEARTPLSRGPVREVTVPFPREVAVDGDGNVYVLADAYVSIPRVVQMVATPQC